MKKIGILTTLIFCSVLSWGQITDQSILMVVGNDTISRGEFVKIYTKNAMEGEELFTPEALNEYMDLYLNFRLKILAAENAGYDTISDIQAELNMYKTQLAQPYLTDKEASEALLKEAYANMAYDLRASHILINLDKKARGLDTVAAYKKAMEAREKILKGQEFEEVVIAYSDDPSAKDSDRGKGNYGDLGYFSVFNMVYPFEQIAYTLKKGEVSMPIRTNFGYHLIKLTDKEPSLGKVQASHILILIPPTATEEQKQVAKDKILKAQEELKAGKPFIDVVKEYSDDKASAANGGRIPEFTVNRMIPEFVSQMYKLKADEVSDVFLSRFGWHIVKFHSSTQLLSYDSLRAEIEYKVVRDGDRGKLPQVGFYQKLRKLYNPKDEKNALNIFSNLVTDSLLNGTWKFTPTSAYDKVLFSYAGKKVTFLDFANDLVKNQAVSKGVTKKELVAIKYKDFVDETLLRHEASLLTEKYPEFTALIKEYRDGIYLFDITNKKVWAKAAQDTVALEEYYQLSKEKYKWPQKVEAIVFSFDPSVLNGVKATKFLTKADKKKWSFEQLQTEAVKAFGEGSYTLVKGVFSPEQNPFVDKAPIQKGISEEISLDGKKNGFVIIQNVIPEQCQTLEEVKGLIIAEFQKYLEDKWIKELKDMYPYTIQQDVLKSLYK